MHIKKALAMAVALVAVPLVVAGCGGSDSKTDTKTKSTEKTDTKLVIYTDQHVELVQSFADAYTKETGVKFDIQPDANVGQVEAEGKAIKADLFLSEDPNSVAALAAKDLLTELDKSTMDQVREGLNSPDNRWVAYAARARVLYYNPDLIKESELPKSLMDITDAKYKGKFAYAPSGAFRATTQYLVNTIGADKTKSFLTDLKANGVNEQKNGNVRDTVDAGKHAMGLSNHYYWYIKAAEVGGPDNMKSKVYHFPGEDAGNLVLASGVGIFSASKNQEEAAKFVAWLTSADGGQKLLAEGDIDQSGAQYPAAKDVSSSIVGSLDDLKYPETDMSGFASQDEAEDLLKSLGLTN